MKTGPLSTSDKYKIQQLIMKDKRTSEIAEAVDRPVEVVENYIEGELATLLDTLNNAKAEPEDEDNEEQAVIINRVTNRLVQNGVTKRDAAKLIRKAIDLIKKAGEEFDENRLYSRCIGQMRTSEFIVKKTVGGNEGVGIMTAAASQRSDMSKNRRKKVARKIKGNVYQPSTGKYLT